MWFLCLIKLFKYNRYFSISHTEKSRSFSLIVTAAPSRRYFSTTSTAESCASHSVSLTTSFLMNSNSMRSRRRWWMYIRRKKVFLVGTIDELFLDWIFTYLHAYRLHRRTLYPANYTVEAKDMDDVWVSRLVGVCTLFIDPSSFIIFLSSETSMLAFISAVISGTLFLLDR